jgi:hypothetical protein
MKVVRPALAVLLLALAVGALLLARDVGGRRDRMTAGDRMRAADPAAQVDWTPATALPFDAAGRVVGLDDDIALRRAIRAFVIARRTGEGFDNGQVRALRRDAAQGALAEVVVAGSQQQAALADVLLGVLSFSGTSAGAGAQSVDAFTEAARLEPSNVAAKFDLELALRALAPKGTRPGSNPSAGGRGQGRRGAGAGLPGSGF